MHYNVHLTLKSNNTKTGPIPVSTTERSTCPPTCGVRNECYAKSGPLSLHWAAVSEGRRGMPWPDFCAAVSKLEVGSIWRHNQAGDLPGDGVTIDQPALAVLVEANAAAGAKGFTYTHYPMTPENAFAVAQANGHGFTVNLSADTLGAADDLAGLEVGPVATVLPSTCLDGTRTPDGRSVVVCPAYTHPGTTCQTCRLCARADREVIVGFPAHGSRYRTINIRLAGR